MTDLEQLAARIEALAGPSREVDAEIYWAVKGFPAAAYSRAMGLRPKGAAQPTELEWLKKSSTLPAYTASLDSAMSLAGDKFGGLIKGHFANGEVAFACRVGGCDAEARTMPLAVAAAAIRARSQNDG